jgi:catechol 2,3-dioxygenase-like lactoylglutathione lyase family enzyme
MKQLHIHIKTRELDKSVDFYTAVFGQAPSKLEADYAKWLLDDPRAHISLSSHGGEPGIDHAGILIETREELDAVAARLRSAGADLLQEEATTCCYAQSNKFWASDPQGAKWELFHTFGSSEKYGDEPDRKAAILPPQPLANDACCSPSK